MVSSHADNHDRDKLSRWNGDLSSNPPNPQLQRGARGAFPVHAVILVSEQDRLAHDIFRRFRSSFEARAAEYQHLTIFGQHGVSKTVLGLMEAFGLAAKPLPLLLLFAEPWATTIYVLALPGGSERVGERLVDPTPVHQGWAKALAGIENVVDGSAPGSGRLDLASVPELMAHQLPGNPADGVACLVGQVLQSLASTGETN